MSSSRQEIADRLLENSVYSVNLVPQNFDLIDGIFRQAVERRYGKKRRRGGVLYKSYPVTNLISLTCPLGMREEVHSIVRDALEAYKEKYRLKGERHPVLKLRIRVSSDMEMDNPEETIYEKVPAFIIR